MSRKNGNEARNRKEHDSLGEVRVPKNALYGAQTVRAIHNFPISGRKPHRSLVRAYLMLKRAAAIANRRSGALDAKRAALIVQASDQLLRTPDSRMSEIFVVDPYQAGAGTSFNMNVNEVLANLGNQKAGGALGTYAPLHPNDHVNRSQSTNDTFPTAMRIAILEASKPLGTELELLTRSFGKKSKSWMGIPKSARTHLQDAVPMRLGQETRAYASTAARISTWLESAQEGLRELGIGGSAAGTGLNVPRGFREAIVRELSRSMKERFRPAPDLCEAMQSQAVVTHYSGVLRNSALELTRICNDLRLLSSGPLTGLAEILLPAVQPGSSIMPGKVNPSILEMANQSFFSVLGYDQTVAYCTQAGQLELNVMMPMMAYSLLEATQVLTQTLKVLRTRCVDGLKPNEARLRHYFESTPQIATALSPKLGYEVTAKLVQEALASGRSVVQVARDKKLVTEKELKALLQIRKLTGS